MVSCGWALGTAVIVLLEMAMSPYWSALHEIPVLFPFQLPGNAHTGRQQVIGQVLGSLLSTSEMAN